MNHNQTYYSFPKGKINQNETGQQGAIREVWEEIGFDITKLISENNFIEYNKNNKKKKMYIVLGIEE